jgi:hypothetical protein
MAAVNTATASGAHRSSPSKQRDEGARGGAHAGVDGAGQSATAVHDQREPAIAQLRRQQRGKARTIGGLDDDEAAPIRQRLRRQRAQRRAQVGLVAVLERHDRGDGHRILHGVAGHSALLRTSRSAASSSVRNTPMSRTPRSSSS